MNIKNILLGCFLASLFFACNIEPKTATKTVVKRIVKQAESSPNKDSELALLMRKMYLDADSIKALIVSKKGTISDEYITVLENVHSAIPTDPDVKTPEFDAFNKSLISQAEVLKAAEGNYEEEFNKLVSRCIDCHQSFCPGPIKRIKKLRID